MKASPLTCRAAIVVFCCMVWTMRNESDTMKKKYYLQNSFGRVEEMWLDNDEEAFRYAQERNRRQYENWKAYNERGDLIFFVFDGRKTASPIIGIR